MSQLKLYEEIIALCPQAQLAQLPQSNLIQQWQRRHDLFSRRPSIDVRCFDQPLHHETYVTAGLGRHVSSSSTPTLTCSANVRRQYMRRQYLQYLDNRQSTFTVGSPPGDLVAKSSKQTKQMCSSCVNTNLTYIASCSEEPDATSQCLISVLL